MRDIQFAWNGKRYRVSGEAYNREYIVLPNGVVLQPTGWLESSPPQLDGAQEVPHLFLHCNPGEIADYMGNAILALESE